MEHHARAAVETISDILVDRELAHAVIAYLAIFVVNMGKTAVRIAKEPARTFRHDDAQAAWTGLKRYMNGQRAVLRRKLDELEGLN